MDARESYRAVLQSLSNTRCKSRGMGTPYLGAYRTLQLNVRHNAPKVLYKYFNIENAWRSIDDLRQGRLYLASPASFDDEYDVRPVYDNQLIEERLREQLTPENMEQTHSFLGQFYPDAYDSARQLFNHQVSLYGSFDNFKEHHIKETLAQLPRLIDAFRSAPRCACLAEDHDSDMMWGLYASKHQGFVAAYATPIEPPNCLCASFGGNSSSCQHKFLPLSLAPVLYEGRKDITDFSDVFGGSTALIPYPTDHLYLAVMNATLFKGELWAEEKEWRLVTLACKHAAEACMYARMRPTAIYLGSRISDEHRTKLTEVANELRIPIYMETIGYGLDSTTMSFKKISL